MDNHKTSLGPLHTRFICPELVAPLHRCILLYHLLFKTNGAIKKFLIFTLTSEKLLPCLIFSQCNSDAADSVAGLHVSILNSLSELILQAQHLRNQFQ